MNKQEVYEFLKNERINHEITEHKAVFNMAELSEIDIPYPEADDLISIIKNHGNAVSITEI